MQGRDQGTFTVGTDQRLMMTGRGGIGVPGVLAVRNTTAYVFHQRIYNKFCPRSVYGVKAPPERTTPTKKS